MIFDKPDKQIPYMFLGYIQERPLSIYNECLTEAYYRISIMKLENMELVELINDEYHITEKGNKELYCRPVEEEI